MLRYMQALAFYLAIVAFTMNLFLSLNSRTTLILVFIVVELLNLMAIVIATHFRKLVYHSLNRETSLADKFGFQKPYPLIFGYYSAIVVVVMIMLGVLFLTLVRYNQIG